MFGTAILLFLLLAVITFHNSPDDALITARYARNVVAGLGPVYNPGERVEGFSSPLHLLLATGLVALPGGFVLLKMKLLSLLFGLLTVVTSAWLVRRLPLPPWAQLVALALVAGSWNLAVSATNGLETSAVVLLCTLLAGLVATGRHLTRPAWTTGAGALLALARPESLLIVALLAASGLVVRPGDGWWPTRSWWARTRWLAGPAVAATGLLAVRLAYYGELVPNTYYAKAIDGGTAAFNGLYYLAAAQPLWQSPFMIVAALLLVVQVAVAAVALVLSLRPVHRWLLPFVAVTAGQLAFVLKAGGDWMMGARFLAPALPCIAVLLAAGLAVAVPALQRAGRLRWALVGLVLVAGLAPVPTLWSPLWKAPSMRDADLIAAGNVAMYSDLWAMSPATVGCLRPGDTVAFSEAGYFAWALPDNRVLDTRGLTESAIAHTAPPQVRLRNGVHDANWSDPGSVVGRVLLERRPEVILSVDGPPVPAPLHGTYRLARTYPWPGTYPLALYERSDHTCREV